MASGDHDRSGHHGHDVLRARCFVLTVSDTRTPADDRGGDLVTSLLEEAGHQVVGRGLVPDEAPEIRRVVLDAVEQGDVDAVVVTGGTGVSPRDVTPEALEPLFRCQLDGFGEAFRSLSFAAIGPAALLSRACAGVVYHTLVFALPGSPDGCRLGVERLIGPMLSHATALLRAAPHPAGTAEPALTRREGD